MYLHDDNLYIYSDCIPKNMPADLKTLIRVTGDFFFAIRERRRGGILNGRSL